MHPRLYEAAMKGDDDVGVIEEYKDQLDVQVTPSNNTVLHVAAQFHNNFTCVEKILEMQSSLVWRVNSKGETPLHIAAREGHHNVVKALIEYAKPREDLERGGVGNGALPEEMLMRMTNEDGDTALHEAVRNSHPDVVQILTKEDPHFSHPHNNAEETPLYLAAERNYCEAVSQILNTCTSPAYSGPDGRTALHSAVIQDCEECSKKLCEWMPALSEKADINGWTPLHYAARFNHASMVKPLLGPDKLFEAYLTADKDDKKTALHISASYGSLKFMEEILKQCPDCWEMTNGRGQNILHIAVENKEEKVIEFISQKSWYISLINQKDDDGNTPLHLYASSQDSKLPNFKKHPRVDMNAFNKENMTPLDVAIFTNVYTPNESSIEGNLESAGTAHGWRNIIRKRKDEIMRRTTDAEEKKNIEVDIRKTAETQLIVAALIAAVTFAAGFTVPGGYDSNHGPDNGMPVLVRKAAFKTFVITDTIGMIFSTCAVFLHFIASAYVHRIRVLNRIAIASFLILIGIGSTVIAFITGLYAVLIPSLGLAIATCVIGCLSFSLYFFLLKRLYDFYTKVRVEKKLRISFILVAADQSHES